MKLIDYLKKLIKTDEFNKSEKKTKKIPFDKVEEEFKNLEKEAKEEQKKILDLIKNKFSEFTKEINEKISILKGIDIDSKKSEDRIKTIVKENLNNYVDYVEKLIRNLNNLDGDIEEITSKINKTFNDFNKKSYMCYQKATILIGKEMEDIKNLIIKFLKNLGMLFNENKDIFDSLKKISFIKFKLSEIDRINEVVSEVDENLMSLNKKLISIKEDKERLLLKLEDIKKTKEYKENIKNQEEIKLIKDELDRYIYKLKELIDLKALANFFHSYNGKMDIVKNYKNNFKAAFHEDNGFNIIRLLNESKLINQDILDMIKNINNKKEEISNFKLIDPSREVMKKIEKLKLDINNLNDEKNREIKKQKKLNINKKEIINLIKSEFEKLDIIIK